MKTTQKMNSTDSNKTGWSGCAMYSYTVFDATGAAVYPVAAFEPYKAQVTVDDLRIRSGPGTAYTATGVTGKGVFTIVGEKPGDGSTAGWGLLKAYQKNRDGWISLDYVKKL